MAEPGVPGGSATEIDLTCGETVPLAEIDLGMRELSCACGDVHAVVTDAHPPSRFLPESLVEVLRETIEPADAFEEFSTPHLMGIVMEEFPEAVASQDCAEDGSVGYALVWVTAFGPRRLHEVVVELVVELMEHALSHADDDAAIEDFERQMLEFDVDAFVEQYRSERDWDDESPRSRG